MEQKYHDLLDQCEPYILCHPNHLGQFNLNYMGQQIDSKHCFNPLLLKDRGFIESLIKLDQLSFGPGGMGMPRWVLFDCALIPGAVVGFGINSSKLGQKDRDQFGVGENEFVPVSMYIAIPCADQISWFGHNLSSLNKILDYPLPGLGLLTKYYALGVMQIKKLYGATQWDSPALGLHLKLAPMQLQASYVPIHTHENTLCYESYDFYSQDEVFQTSVHKTGEEFEVSIDAIKKLQQEIEAGKKVKLLGRGTKQSSFYLSFDH